MTALLAALWRLRYYRPLRRMWEAQEIKEIDDFITAIRP